MPFDAAVYQVLIASPSDVNDERDAIEDVLRDWNGEHGRAEGLLLLPVRWEKDVRPTMGQRPQESVNEQIVRPCDVLVGVFWNRLGTRTGEAESGTVEEINECVTGRKPVLLYFSTRPVSPTSVDTSQLDRLRSFKEDCQKASITYDFESIDKLCHLFRRHIGETVHELRRRTMGHPLSSSVQNTGAQTPTTSRFALQFRSFLYRYRSEWEAQREQSIRNIEEGKQVLSGLIDPVSRFMENASRIEVVDNLGQLLSDVRQLLNYNMIQNGKIELREFWHRGDALFARLEGISTTLR